MFSRILATGSFLPPKILSNHDLAEMVDTSDEWIVTRTGIEQRHVVSANENTLTLALAASKQAISRADIDAASLDMIIVATSTPPKVFPSTACLLQEALDIAQHAAPAFDVVAACAGFSYALSTADQYIRNGSVKRVLVVGAEAMSQVVDWQDRTTCILFGDGAGACILEASDKPGILSHHLHADGRYKDLLFVPNCTLNNSDSEPHMFMDGSGVFKQAVSSLSSVLEEALAANNLPASAIDWLIPHQANLRIINAMAKRLGLSAEKVIVTIAKHGNTSAASIPIALDTAITDGRIKRGDTMLLESFGGGFAWGASIVVY